MGGNFSGLFLENQFFLMGITLKIKVGILWGLLAVLCGCGKGGEKATESFIEEQAQVRLLLRNTMPITIDSLVLEASGEGMNTFIHKEFAMVGNSLELRGIVPGPDRIFRVKIWHSGVIVQEGETVASLQQGEHLQLSIHLRALRGYLLLEIPVGMEQEPLVSGGALILCRPLRCDTLSLHGNGPLRRFRSGPLPFNEELQLRIWLWNSRGDTLYHAQQALNLQADMPWRTIALSALMTSLELSMQWAQEPELRSLMVLPNSRKRRPLRRGELIFTELHPNPRTSGNEYEWVELFNTGTDTLLLDSCRIAKDRITTGSTTVTALRDILPIAPGAFVVLGRDSVDFAMYRYGGFTLSNTSQSVLLACGSLVVDSVHYNSPADSLNPFPVTTGATMQASLENARSRELGIAWCVGRTSFSYVNGVSGLGSPGRDAICISNP